MTGWRLLCSGLVFVAISTTVGAGLGQLAGGLREAQAWISFGAGAVAAVATWGRAHAPRQKITLADGLLFAIFAIASLRAFLWVIYEQGNELKVLSPHNLGDMSLHLNLIRRWAAGGDFWPENPFMSGAIFPYHPGMDLWNALLAIVGVPVFEGLRWTGLLGAAATAAALWRWGRGFALAAFLFAGGLSAWTYFTHGSLSATEEGVAWKNLFLSMFVTQRGLLYSLPAGLVLMCVWRAQLRGEKDGPSLAALPQVALYATMPLFNAPAFLFLSALLAACFFAGWKRGHSRPFLTLGLVSVIPATWLVALVTANFTAPSALRFAAGWMQENQGLWFWLWNFGALLPLLALLGFVVLRRGDRASRVFYLLGAGTLVFCFLFVLAPWAWDNTKLMLWGYLAVMPLLWSELIAKWPFVLRGVACVVLFFSGAVTLANGIDERHGYGLANRPELADTEFLLRRVPADARVACLPLYNHPVLLLGQPVTMGHDGHLFSQGLDYSPVQRDVDALMSGGADWRNAARRLQVQYLLWGPREAAKWPASAQPWKSCAQIVADSGESGTLYFIAPCLLGDD
ncbi:MAG: hypothetical protein ACKOAL_00535 [Chthoniobacterales bacterium]